MGRLERKLLALLVLVAGVPLVVAFLLSRGLFERTMQAAVDPGVDQQLESSVQFFREFVRAEKGRQRAIARGLAADGTVAGLIAARDTEALRAYLLPYVRRPRVLKLTIQIPEGQPAAASPSEFAPDEAPASDGGVEVEPEASPAPALLLDLSPTRPEGRWREDTLTLPIAGSAARGVLTYTYGLEQRFFDQFSDLEQEAIAPMSALKADQDNQATILAWGFMASLGVSVLAASLLAVYIGRRTTRRLMRLREAMEIVAEGDLALRLTPEGRDEVADLFRHFNEMAEGLEEGQARVQYLTQVSAWQGIARRMAHEIKNPLTPILLSVQQAHSRYRGEDAGFRRVIDTTKEIVEHEVETLRRLVSEFSEFARLPQVEPEPIDLAPLPSALKAAHPEVERFEAQDGASALVAMVDRGLLRQALSNLVINAWDAANEGDDPQVAMIVEADGGGVALHIDDSGPGVPPDRRGQIFEPYITGKSHGTGLGLAIVKKVVVDHRGRIEVTDGPLGGARFTIWLPLAQADTPA